MKQNFLSFENLDNLSILNPLYWIKASLALFLCIFLLPSIIFLFVAIELFGLKTNIKNKQNRINPSIGTVAFSLIFWLIVIYLIVNFI